MKIGIIADLHIANLERPKPGEKPGNEKTEKLSAFYAKAADFDFVINLGDFIAGSDNGNQNYMTASTVSRAYISSTVKTYYVLGNRDSVCLPKDLLLHCTEKLGGAYTFLVNDTRFIALDANYTCDGKPYEPGYKDWTDTMLPAAQLDFLQDCLNKNDFRQAIVLCHQRLDMFMNENEMLNPHVVSNADAAREIMERSGKVMLVLQAHYHSGDVTEHNGITYYTQKAFMDGEKAKYGILTVNDGDGTKRFTIEGAEL